MLSGWGDIFGGLLTGGIGGFASGLLGITSGGILVPLLMMILGSEQHAAQGISLVAQVVPTSLSGVQRYRQGGHRTPLAWVALLAAGFCVGGAIGALFANSVSDRALRWTFFAYLVLLEIIVLSRSPQQHASADAPHDVVPEQNAHWAPLLAIGVFAGISSGFLGIGGGLALTVLMVAVLKLKQHQSQALSLAVTALPVTLPAAWLYVQQGQVLPWVVIGALIVGLWIGTALGSAFANRIDERHLRRALIVMIAGMAIYMAVKASV